LSAMNTWTSRLNTLFFFALSILGYIAAGAAISGLMYSMNPQATLSVDITDMCVCAIDVCMCLWCRVYGTSVLIFMCVCLPLALTRRPFIVCRVQKVKSCPNHGASRHADHLGCRLVVLLQLEYQTIVCLDCHRVSHCQGMRIGGRLRCIVVWRVVYVQTHRIHKCALNSVISCTI
jgi:hypothetical protein